MGIGSKFQKFKDKVFDRTRKLIPNELADIAVKAAPFVAMIPGQQGTAALMRGLGRFDQRGDPIDALKQAGMMYVGGKIVSPYTGNIIPGLEGNTYEGIILRLNSKMMTQRDQEMTAVCPGLDPGRSSGSGQRVLTAVSGGPDGGFIRASTYHDHMDSVAAW